MTDAQGKPKNFTLPIQGGLLDNLGINMYANLGKCLVEFAANAYDGDSPSVEIELDENSILTEREVIRKAAIKAAKEAGKKRPTFIEDALPNSLTVVIRDNGHGMSPQEVQQKYLPINRNRRKVAGGEETQIHTEAGKRFVMGRKGIGKLSGFGAASLLTIRTKRAGQTFATEFRLDVNALRNEANLSEVPIPASYIDSLSPESQGTTVTLSGLKCDSVKFTLDDLEEALAEAFYPINEEEFSIKINGKSIKRPAPEYEYLWPESLDADGYAEDKAVAADDAELPLRYVAKFRKKHLPAAKRGARVYCNKRLALGPSLIDLNTGTHNFMAHQYMEFIVQADELDRQNVDLISTDRGDIRRNNDLVEAFLFRLTKLMQSAIAAHGKFRDGLAVKIINEDPRAKVVRDILDALPRSQQSSGRKIVNVIVARHGIDSTEFSTIAPLLVQTMNAGEVLVDLIKASNNPTDITDLARHILELRLIEKSDALKLYRARRNGIHGLRTITNRGEDEWVKGPQTEKEFHELLKKAPWLIRADLAGYLASDITMDKTIDVLAKTLGVDHFAAAEERSPDKKRPDLVFLLADAQVAARVLVVELKSPNIPLEVKHLTQLETYIRKVEDWVATEYAGQRRKCTVEGMLIGAMPDTKTSADGQRDLLARISKRGAGDQWEVVGLRELLARTEAVHGELIAAIETEEAENSAADAEVKPQIEHQNQQPLKPS